MNLNEAVIPHYRAEMKPIELLKKEVKLNEKYLKEKPTWYEIEKKLQYFKIRNDFRLFTEQFFSIFAKDVLGIDTLDYKVAYLRTIIPGENPNKEVAKCGLLSENFQSNKYNYYLVSELMNAEISEFINYGGYTLENLLAFLKELLDEKDYTKNELFLIKLFIADAFTHQEDRNYHNIGFKIPKIDGVPYTRRLHPNALPAFPTAKDYYKQIENGNIILNGMEPTKAYDNERILGFDHKNVFKYQKGQVWCPLFPYSADTLFQSQEEAQKAKEKYDGFDPNLFELYVNHEDVCKPIFERLAYGDDYKKVLKHFEGSTSQISLSKDEEEKIMMVFKDKKEVFKKILKM